VPTGPTEIRVSLTPAGRFDVIELTRRIENEFGDVLRRYPRALYCSFHTTAGYLGRSLAARLHHHQDKLDLFFRGFRSVFPPNAPYRHDQMHLRRELSEAQREVEPKNGDSHLTFIGAGMRNCVTYSNAEGAPVFFVDLDGVNEGRARRRETSILCYEDEQLVERVRLKVPLSRHPIDSVNLADPKLGLMEVVDDLLKRSGLEKGRVDIALAAAERHAGLTVNEYETLLMQHDLTEVLRDPLKYAALKGRHMLDDPLAIPGKTLNYARYDVVRILNTLMEAFKVSESVVESLVAKVMAVPARHLLRSRKVSFLASDAEGAGGARLVRGVYQSPILVQWDTTERQTREIDVSLIRLS
jgi:hypothetical protein